MSKVSKNIMEQIKEGEIKPRPRWQFVLMNLILIISLILTVLAGGVVMSIVFLKLFNLEWSFVSINGEHGPALFQVLPLIWLLLLVLVMVLSLRVFEQMEGGYKYHPIWVVIGSVFLSIFLGGIIYATKGADIFDNSLRGALPPYGAMENAREMMFLRPDRGLLPGKIVELTLPTGLKLEDLKENIWEVDFLSELSGKPILGNLQEGQIVMVIGYKSAANKFMAKDIRTQRAFGENLKNKIFQNRLDKFQLKINTNPAEQGMDFNPL